MPSLLVKVIICIVVTAMATSSADFGDRPVDWTANESKAFRDYAIRNFNQSNILSNQYWAYYWLNQKYLELNLVSPQPIGSLTVLTLNKKSINAFAIPGNIIGIHEGLWKFADNEDEFLSVLAHEMAHIALDHFTRFDDNSNGQGWIVAAGFILASLIAQENPEAANAALIGSFATLSQNRIQFSQAIELEADQLAQAILLKSNYNSESGRSFFQKLEQATLNPNTQEFLQSHPLGTTRASRLALNNQSQQIKSDTLTGFDAVRASLLNDYEKFEQSRELFDDSALSNEKDPNILLGWYQHQFKKDKNVAHYLKNIERLTQVNRGFLPAHFLKLKILHAQNSVDLCRELSDFTALINDEYVTLDVLQEIKDISQKCNLESKIEWRARWLWESGQEEQALDLLSQGLKSDLKTNQIARINNRLRSYNELYERFR